MGKRGIFAEYVEGDETEERLIYILIELNVISLRSTRGLFLG